VCVHLRSKKENASASAANADGVQGFGVLCVSMSRRGGVSIKGLIGTGMVWSLRLSLVCLLVILGWEGGSGKN
jgi:hypothetical protein